MSFTAVPVGPGWGFDASVKLTGIAEKCVATPLPNGQVSFIFRYVSLSQPFYKVDIDPAERDEILATGATLLLVQHVAYPFWQASAALGAQHGNIAGLHAQSIEYPAGAMLFVDMEGIANTGGPVDEYLTAWAYAVQGFGITPCMYDGYACGIDPSTLAQHIELGGFWSDFGSRVPPPGVGFMCKQFPEVSHCGIPAGPDQCYPDSLGRTLVGMRAA